MLSGTAPTVALPLVLLAAGLLCLPGPPGRGRLTGLAGGSARGSGPRLPTGPAALLAGALGGLLLAGPAGALCGLVGVAVYRGRRARGRIESRGRIAAGELADALARITDELRTGAHPAAALAGVGHDGPRARELLAPAAAAARLGEPVPVALRRAAGHGAGVASAADLERIAASWELADRHGAPLADLLAGTLDDIRWRSAHGSRVRAQLAGPRATATVLTALPLFGIGLGQLTGTDPIGVLRDGLLGQGLLVAGCGLTAAGMSWSERILRAAVAR